MNEIFTHDEALELYAKHRAGQSVVSLADEYYCCRETIYNTFKRHGLKPTGQRTYTRKPVGMICTDWNCNTPAQRIAVKYGFASTNALHRFVTVKRNQGWEFAYRKNRVDITDVIADWHAGVPTDEICKRHKINRSTMHTRFTQARRAGLTVHRRTRTGRIF